MNALPVCDPQKRTEHTRLSPAELREIVADRDRWVSEAIAEFITGIPGSTLRRFRAEGIGPRYVKCESRCRYKVAWLLEYLEDRIVETRDSRRQPEEACV